MDDDLKQALMAMEERLVIRIGGVEDRLTGVLEDRIAGVEARLTGVLDDRIAGVEARLTGVLDDGIAGVEARLTGIDGKIAGMVARIAGVEDKITSMDARIAGVEGKTAGLEAKIADTEARLIERMRDMQTELLKAFGPWQENVQVRVRQMEKGGTNSEEAMKSRMDTLERRLAEIEKRLLMNPPAA